MAFAFGSIVSAGDAPEQMQQNAAARMHDRNVDFIVLERTTAKAPRPRQLQTE